jgi:hypothetical protein
VPVVVQAVLWYVDDMALVVRHNAQQPRTAL